MASKKDNIKALFLNTRSRVIILLTIFLLSITISVGVYKFKTPASSIDSAASVAAGPGGIKSIPGSANPTAQYAFLQEKQNIEQAKKAIKSGGSAIPTIVRSESFGAGIEAVGPKDGKGALGFSSLTRDDLTGPQRSLWIQKLKQSNCSKASVAAVLGQGAGLSDLKTVCTCAQLKDNGYTLKELDTVCTCPNLKAAGFNAIQFKADGYSAERLRACGFDACEMRAAGFSTQDLRDAGYSDGELKGAGYPQSEIEKIGGLPEGVTESDIRAAGCQVQALKRLKAEGVTAAAIRRLSGCSAAQLKAAGYTAKELKAAGFTAAELKNAGFSAKDLKDAGFSAAALSRATGHTATELKAAHAGDATNCSSKELEAAHAAGESASKIRETLGCSAAALKAAGYTAAELKKAGFTAAELKAAGFSAADLKNAGFNARELRAAGFTPDQLKSAGFSNSEIRNAGYSTRARRESGIDQEPSALASLGALNETPTVPSQAQLPSLTGGLTAKQTQAAANEKKLNEILARQREHMAEQRYQQKIQQQAGLMAGAANQALQGWKVGFSQVLVAGGEPDKDTDTTSTASSRSGSQLTNEADTSTRSANAPPPAIRAGEVIFAVLDTSVNSDQPGPILATIVSGRYTGAKLIGSFTMPSNADKIVISFNMMSVPGASKTTSINAYAIDPNTARTALSSRVNHHYLLRYGALFASTFVEGFGNAFQSAGTTVVIGSTGGMSTTTVSNGAGRSILENAVIGLSTVGNKWSSVAMRNVDTPVTVDVYSGTGLGILFTQDVPVV